MKVAPSLMLILAMVVGHLRAGASAPWKIFVSRSQHFSVMYPSSWNRMQDVNVPPNPDMLEIINFPNAERVEGVVIKKGGASISVNLAPEGIRSTEDWIHRYYRWNVILDDKTIPTSLPVLNGCPELRRIVSRDEIAPNAYFVEAEYLCATKDGLYVVLLTNWEGDSHQTAYQDIALKVALSLRTR